MSFLQPTYLWGLFAVLVPFVIHLLNKGDAKTIKVGSIRYLTEQETKQTRQIKLNELLLLFLRMFLLSLLVCAMAQPVLSTKKTKVPLTYIIEPSLLNNGKMDAVLRDAQEVPKRFFLKDFPVVDRDNIPIETPKYWQLAQELQHIESESIVVFSTGKIKGVQGMRPTISKNVRWVLMDEDATTDSLVGATAVKDGVILHTVKSEAGNTDIVQEHILKEDIIYGAKDSISVTQNGASKNIPLSLEDTLRIGITYDDEFLKEKELLAAAFKAVGKYTQSHLELKEVADSKTFNENYFDLSVWLKRSTPPKIKGKLIQYLADSLATSSINKTATKTLYYLTRRLTIERVLNERLADELAMILIDRPILEERMRMLDKRTMPEADFLPIRADLAPADSDRQQRGMANWFWIAALIVLMLERLLAKFRKQ
ncbi:BatA domain-containing protein [Maribacter chungangensis]|uniref:BatA domain-containing protein n=1 Tax=Maribacter chungangensis TaxID=1069117 RepID=A0ABW3B680_9FLAO